MTPVLVNMSNVTGDSGWMKFAGGPYHGCGLKANGKVYCWGLNSTGSIGDGTTSSRHTPTLINSSDTFIDVSVGSQFTCAINSAGYLTCWGKRTNGVLGDGLTTPSASSPVVLSSAERYLQVTSGSGHSCALNSEGRLVY